MIYAAGVPIRKRKEKRYMLLVCLVCACYSNGYTIVGISSSFSPFYPRSKIIFGIISQSHDHHTMSHFVCHPIPNFAKED